MEPTKEELEAIPSIWDGWQKQFRYPDKGSTHYSHGIHNGQHDCGLTFLVRQPDGRVTELPHELEAAVERIATYIIGKYGLPSSMSHRCVIAHANNNIGLTPDDFRHIDRLTQWQAMQKQIDAIPEPIAEPKEIHAD